MAANILDAIVLFGDSITQGSWDLNGIAARLSRQYTTHLPMTPPYFAEREAGLADPRQI